MGSLNSWFISNYLAIIVERLFFISLNVSLRLLLFAFEFLFISFGVVRRKDSVDDLWSYKYTLLGRASLHSTQGENHNKFKLTSRRKDMNDGALPTSFRRYGDGNIVRRHKRVKKKQEKLLAFKVLNETISGLARSCLNGRSACGIISLVGTSRCGVTFSVERRSSHV